MNDRDPNSGDLFNKAKTEISGMAKQGLEHPSTKPVLAGAAVGAVAGWVLPLVSPPLGLVAGAGIALWMRLKR